MPCHGYMWKSSHRHSFLTKHPKSEHQEIGISEPCRIPQELWLMSFFYDYVVKHTKGFRKLTWNRQNQTLRGYVCIQQLVPTKFTQSNRSAECFTGNRFQVFASSVSKIASRAYEWNGEELQQGIQKAYALLFQTSWLQGNWQANLTSMTEQQFPSNVVTSQA